MGNKQSGEPREGIRKQEENETKEVSLGEDLAGQNPDQLALKSAEITNGSSSSLKPNHQIKRPGEGSVGTKKELQETQEVVGIFRRLCHQDQQVLEHKHIVQSLISSDDTKERVQGLLLEYIFFPDTMASEATSSEVVDKNKFEERIKELRALDRQGLVDFTHGFLSALSSTSTSASASASTISLDTVVPKLLGESFAKKGEIIKQIQEAQTRLDDHGVLSSKEAFRQRYGAENSSSEEVDNIP